MVFIIFALVVLIVGIVLAIVNRHRDDMDSCPYAVFGVVIAIAVFVGLFAFAPSVEYYTDFRYSDNPVISTPLKAIPFEPFGTTSIYVVKEKNSVGNSEYNYYATTENGLEEQVASTDWDVKVYIQYLKTGEEPYVEHLSVSKERELVKKPSFWFNIVGWHKYKDFSIGDICETVADEYEETYVFHVPEGSLREVN